MKLIIATSLWLMLYLAICSREVNTSNVLIFCSTPFATSHYGYLHAVAPGLVHKGYTVYSLIHRGAGVAERAKQMGIIPIFYGYENNFKKGFDELDALIYQVAFKKEHVFKIFGLSAEIMLGACEEVVTNETMMTELKHIGFDLVIYDSYGSTPCAPILPVLLEVPYIGMSSNYFWWLVRNPALPTFMPSLLDDDATENMSFVQRLKNLLLYVILNDDTGVLSVFGAFTNMSLIERFLGNDHSLTWTDLNLKAELLFITRDELLEWSYPLMPQIISVACITCFPANPLPSHMEEEISTNGHGVVLVSLGSLVNEFPDFLMRKLVHAFKQVKHIVFIKYAGANVPYDIPNNIKFLKWLPQNDILGHPKTKMFITHCGNNGQYEALYHGVPMIGIPVMFEQKHNALRMEDKTYGITLDLDTFTPEDLVGAIQTITNDSVYTRNAKIASRKLKGRPMGAREKAAYWVQHVLKHGNRHLRSAAVDLPLVEFWMLDILLFFSVLMLVLVCVCHQCYARLLFK